MELQKKKAIENMLSMANERVILKGGEDRSEPQGEDSKTLVQGREPVPVEQLAQDNTTRVPNKGPDLSSEIPTQGFSQKPQVCIDHAPSPHSLC